MTCADLEILLADYFDGTLAAGERHAVEKHLEGCMACSALAADIRTATQFMARVEHAEPPPQLLTRILYHTQTEPAPELAAASASGSGALGWIRNLFQPVLEPRFAMGMAMTILSFAMLGRFAGVPQRQLTAADLSPQRIWQSLDTKMARAYDRAVKYYENLRLVYEIQNRLQEWSAQEREERRQQSSGEMIEPDASPTPARESNSGADNDSQRRMNR